MTCKSDRRRRRLGPTQPSQSLPRLACAYDARLQDGGQAVPGHSGHIYLVRAHGLHDFRDLHDLRMYGSSATARAARQGH